jgi:hypothetical protein
MFIKKTWIPVFSWVPDDVFKKRWTRNPGSKESRNMFIKKTWIPVFSWIPN